MNEPAAPSETWPVTQLGDLFTILDSQRVPVNAAQRASRQGNIPYYGATGRVGSIDSHLFDEELVLLGEDGAPFLQGDKPKAYVIKGKSWVNNHAHVLRARGGTPSLFWKYQLDQVQYRPFVSGTTRLKLSQAPMCRIPLLVPPLPEQHRIVEAIESYFTRLGDAVATLERVQRNLKRYRASMLKAAVEGRLVPTEAELARTEGRDYEPASVLLERILAERYRRWQEAGGRGKYQEPVVPDANDLPELPEGWCWSTVDALTISGSQNGVYVPKAKYGAGVPILRIDDYQTDWSRSSNELQRVDISDADAEKYGVAVGDIVINRVNSPSHLGKSLAVLERNIPAVFESNMMRFALTAGVIPGFIQYYLSSTEGKARLTKNAKWAVNQASINQGDVGATAAPLPPVTEQRRIVAELATLLSTVAASEVASTIAVARCARLRQSILKWAFEGKLADHDPSDEPATALLERIRSQTLANRLSVGDTEVRRLRRGST